MKRNKCIFCGSDDLIFQASRDGLRRNRCRDCKSFSLPSIPLNYKKIYSTPNYFETPREVKYGYHIYNDLKSLHFAQGQRRWKFIRPHIRKIKSGRIRLLDIGAGPDMIRGVRDSSIRILSTSSMITKKCPRWTNVSLLLAMPMSRR